MKFCSWALALTFIGSSSIAESSTYFADPFNSNPALSNTQAPGVWYPDRYRPAQFDSFFFDGDNRLRIGISAADGAALRPGGQTGTFYNTQGRKFDLGNGVYTSLKADLYVANDWDTNFRRSDIWATALNGSNAIVHYPIIGFANVAGTTGNIVCRAYDSSIGNWVNVSSQVPGGITTNRWYTIEIRIKPGVFEYLIDGKVVYIDNSTNGAVSFADVIMQAYNFNDAALGAGNYPAALNDSYDAYWDNMVVGPIPTEAFPVDLNGSYRSPSSGPMSPTVGSASGLAVAATVPLGFGSIFERNGVNAVADNAVNGTFTPFNDVTKIPNALAVANAGGTAIEADVELGGAWKPFQWGQGIGNVPPFATGDTFAVGWVNGFNSFGVRFATTLSGQYITHLASTRVATGSIAILDTNGTPATLPAGTTRVRVNASVVGGLLTGTVTPLDGPSAMSVFSLGSTNGLNMDTNSPWALDYTACGFVAGFETHEHVAADASATVTNYTTNAVPNALFMFADDPYVKSSDAAIYYRVGQANLAQTVTGFQAFMNALGGQTFASGSYAGPYTTFIPVTITSLLNAAGAANTDNQANTTVVNLVFTPGAGEVATGAGFRPNSGTEVNLFAGGPPNFNDITATTSNSNTVVIDNTAPVLTPATLGGSAYVTPNVTVGSLELTMTATDLGAQQSGLNSRPAGTITWSNLTTTNVSTFSLTANQFRAVVPITSSTPNGTATLSMTVCDRAGNCTTQVVTFNVSTVNAYLTLVQWGVTANVNRVIEFTFGGTGGSQTPITLRKVVTFNVPTMVGSDPSREGTVTISYQELDLADNGNPDNSVPPAAAITRVYVKDPFFSLGKREPVSGPPSSLTGSVIMRMGDVTNNNVVNVSDLAVWAANNGSSMNPNTTLSQLATPRQANIDGAGAVDLFDRNLIVSSWLFAGDSSVGNYSAGGGNGSQTVEQVIKETRLPASLVKSMDLNEDGWITREEVLRWRKR